MSKSEAWKAYERGIEKMISIFMKRQLEEQKRSKCKEKKQVCIKPDLYIGKEIQYQTALLHEILEELRKSKGSDEATLTPTEATVGSEETKIKGIIIDLTN